MSHSNRLPQPELKKLITDLYAVGLTNCNLIAALLSSALGSDISGQRIRQIVQRLGLRTGCPANCVESAMAFIGPSLRKRLAELANVTRSSAEKKKAA